MSHSLKTVIKESLLGLGLYHKVNQIRFRNDERNISQQRFYAKVIGKDDLVFDVGANVGQRSEIFAKLARKVVAVEPQPNCIRHLKSRFRFNRKVVIEEVAIGEHAGHAKMWQSNSSGISSMSRQFIETMGKGVFSDQKWDREIRVPIRTLDELVAIHGLPAFLKIDVEGYELLVLKGLSKPIPFISFEYAPELIDQARACADRINEISADYQFNYCLGENLEFVLAQNVEYKTFSAKTLDELSQLDTFGDVYAILPNTK
jgi:FkbM family methyltransferase